VKLSLLDDSTIAIASHPGRINAKTLDRKAMRDPTTDSSMRAFVALELPDEARAFCAKAMDRARSALGPDGRAVRWVDPEAIHLTLKFLGSVASARIPEVVERVAQTVANAGAFPIAVGGLGLFPNQRAPRVIWLALHGDLAALCDCQERVEIATVPLGFPREKRPFQPHLTLGRVREGAALADLATIGRLPMGWPTDASAPFLVTSISLMQSHLGPGGARYTRVAALDLRAG
jgi:RNA 2',3'-cyclic 3'-phosphodiesterase